MATTLPTEEQTAVLHAAQDRYPTVKSHRMLEVESPMEIIVEDKDGKNSYLWVQPDGVTRVNGGYVPIRLYGKQPDGEVGDGIPKHAKKYLP